MLTKQIILRLVLLAVVLNNSLYLCAQPSVIYDKAKEKIFSFTQNYASDLSWNIAQITLEGNRITKDYIVMREVPLKKGGKIQSGKLLETLEVCRINLQNTKLFLEVIPVIDTLIADDLFIRFILKERWYILPFPYFNIVDRNPNQWLFEQNADLARVNYGVKFTWDNLTGRRDQLRVLFINGYSRQLLIHYENPYMGKKMEHGYLVSAEYSTLRQTTYATDRHKQVFFPATTRTDIDYASTSLGFKLGYTYRKGVKFRHQLSIAYREERIADSINRLILLNSNKGYRSYFPGNRDAVSFMEVDYQFNYLNVDYNPYPWKGFASTISLTHQGLGFSPIHVWELNMKSGKYIPFGKKNSLAFVGMGLLKLPYEQPMYSLSGLGLKDIYVRGLEYYLINCVAGGILKTTLRREIFNLNVSTVFKKSDKYKKIPFKIVGKIYNDLGAAHLPFTNSSFLNNRLLYSFGFGLDILSYYDFIAQFDFSANQLGEKGLFLHLRQEF